MEIEKQKYQPDLGWQPWPGYKGINVFEASGTLAGL